MSWFFKRHSHEKTQKSGLAKQYENYQEQQQEPLPTEMASENPVIVNRIRELQERKSDDTVDRRRIQAEIRRLEAQRLVNLERRLMTRRFEDKS